MRELIRWTLPGLVVAGPLHLLLGGWQLAPPWLVWVAAAPVIGFVLQQGVRCRFEAQGNGFRSPYRGALAVIIERGNLAQRADRGDVAYQVYEVVFYQRPDWQAARDHAHRCWDIIFLCWSTSLACSVGAIVSLLALWSHPGPAVLYLLVLSAAGLMLRRKGQQTHAALELFDRGLVVSNWPLYESVLRTIATPRS